MKSKHYVNIVFTIISLLRLTQSMTTAAFFILSSQSSSSRRTYQLNTRVKLSKKDDENQKDKSEGYKFGNITRNFIRSVSGNDEYELGDGVKSIDNKVKDSIAKMSGKETYEFGDLSKLLDQIAKDKVNNFTGKQEYSVGDVTKEILRRATSGEYKLDDIILLFKILLALGAELNPVVSILPVKLLVEILDYSIVSDISNKLIDSASRELDQRMKKAVTGDANYKIGDVTKKAIMKYIGKDNYSFGDITRKALEDHKKKKSQ